MIRRREAASGSCAVPAYLRCRSYYSHLWGTASPRSLCEAAKRCGARVIGLTDRGGLYGLVPFLREAERAELLPVIGAELTRNGERVVLVAETDQGYRHLCTAVSEFHMSESQSLADIVRSTGNGLVLLCPPGELLRQLRRTVSRANVLFMEITPGMPFRVAKTTAEQLDVAVVATWPVSFPDRSDRETHRLARAVALRTTLGRVGSALAPEVEYMPRPEEFRREFEVWPEALENNRLVAERCARRWDVRALVNGVSPEREEDRDELRRRCIEGALTRYGGLPEAVAERMERELAVIAYKGFSGYFLLVERLVREASVRCGRGSAAGSLVSYCLGLTGVDPLEHDLLFERFLSEGRPDPPDIDIDLPWDQRHGILRQALERLGPRRAAMVGTHVHMDRAGAVYETAKAAGLPPKDVARVTRRLRRHFADVNPEDHPSFRGLNLAPPWPSIVQKAGALHGMPKHLSVHCGGVVTGKPSLWAKVPVQRSRTGFAVVQWDKDQVEEAGLVKVDILGNRSLAVVRDTLCRLRRHGNDIPPYHRLQPLADPATRSLIASGNTMGVFYVESPPMRQLLAKARRGDFNHLVIHSSIIRPAAYRHIAEYLRRLSGAPRPDLHPLAEEVLSSNYGLMFYQEDVTRVAMRVGGFTAPEAEGLRRCLSKKRGHTPLVQFRDRFLRGASRRGLTEAHALELWAMMQSFAGYSFCKAHSASYAMVSFKAAYLKAHYPGPFMAAVLSNGGGYYSPLAYVWETRRHGIRVLLPHINESFWRYTADDTALRVGLMEVKGIGRAFADAIVRARETDGPFPSLKAFWHRLAPSRTQLDALVKAGCFDDLEPTHNRSQLLWISEALARRSRSPQTDLWAEEELRAPYLPPPQERQRWAQEVEAFGFPVTGTPLDPYRDLLKAQSRVPAHDLHDVPLGCATLAGWLLTRKQARTKRKEPMEFLSFDDGTGLFEVTVFPNLWRACVAQLRAGQCYLVRGRIEEEHDVRSVTATELTPLSVLARAA